MRRGPLGSLALYVLGSAALAALGGGLAWGIGHAVAWIVDSAEASAWLAAVWGFVLVSIPGGMAFVAVLSYLNYSATTDAPLHERNPPIPAADRIAIYLLGNTALFCFLGALAVPIGLYMALGFGPDAAGVSVPGLAGVAAVGLALAWIFGSLTGRRLRAAVPSGG